MLNNLSEYEKLPQNCPFEHIRNNLLGPRIRSLFLLSYASWNWENNFSFDFHYFRHEYGSLIAFTIDWKLANNDWSCKHNMYRKVKCQTFRQSFWDRIGPDIQQCQISRSDIRYLAGKAGLSRKACRIIRSDIRHPTIKTRSGPTLIHT